MSGRPPVARPPPRGREPRPAAAVDDRAAFDEQVERVGHARTLAEGSAAHPALNRTNEAPRSAARPHHRGGPPPSGARGVSSRGEVPRDRPPPPPAVRAFERGMHNRALSPGEATATRIRAWRRESDPSTAAPASGAGCCAREAEGGGG